MTMRNVNIAILAFGSSLFVACAKKTFSGGVSSGSPKKIPALEDTTNPNQDDDDLEGDKKPEADTKPETTDTFAQCDTFKDTNIVAELYPISESAFQQSMQKPLASQSYQNPTKTFCMGNLDIPLRSFDEGFPGFPDLKSWFILDIKFALDIPESGNYAFLMDSDDGSIVTVNGQELINLDGLRDGNMKIYEERNLQLEKGLVEVRVQYMQGPGPDLALMLKWKRPGQEAPELIPAEFIRAPKARASQE